MRCSLAYAYPKCTLRFFATCMYYVHVCVSGNVMTPCISASFMSQIGRNKSFYKIVWYNGFIFIGKCRYVGNIHPQVTETLLQEVFASTGPLEGCKLIRKDKVGCFVVRLYVFHMLSRVGEIHITVGYGEIPFVWFMTGIYCGYICLAYEFQKLESFQFLFWKPANLSSPMSSIFSHPMDLLITMIADQLPLLLFLSMAGICKQKSQHNQLFFSFSFCILCLSLLFVQVWTAN